MTEGAAMTDSDNGSSIFDTWADDPLAAGVAAALGAVAGAAIASSFQLTATLSGDEPPIRVRHGSMRIQLLQRKQTRKFVPDGNPKKWKVDGKADRAKEAYLVVVLSDDPTQIVVVPGNNVVIVYSDGKWVHFKATGHKTRITAERDLQLHTDQELKYNGSGGHIAKVEVDGDLVYDSQGLDPALQIVLLDR
jgi:hypothetical protein